MSDVTAPPDRRAEILAAAARRFAASGFHGASMKAICAEVGMSPGSIYHYFPSKEAIIAAIVAEDRAQIRREVEAAAAAPDMASALADRLLAYLRHLEAEDGRELRLMLEVTAELARNADLADAARAAETGLRAAVARVLAAAQAAGRIAADRDPDLLAGLLLALADGLVWRLAYDDRSALDAGADALAAALAALVGEGGR